MSLLQKPAIVIVLGGTVAAGVLAAATELMGEAQFINIASLSLEQLNDIVTEPLHTSYSNIISALHDGKYNGLPMTIEYKQLENGRSLSHLISLSNRVPSTNWTNNNIQHLLNSPQDGNLIINNFKTVQLNQDEAKSFLDEILGLIGTEKDVSNLEFSLSDSNTLGCDVVINQGEIQQISLSFIVGDKKLSLGKFKNSDNYVVTYISNNHENIAYLKGSQTSSSSQITVRDNFQSFLRYFVEQQQTIVQDKEDHYQYIIPKARIKF